MYAIAVFAGPTTTTIVVPWVAVLEPLGQAIILNLSRNASSCRTDSLHT
jgi:hypothetical protein